MPDDHRRAERLRQEPRTDRTVQERALRFFEALQTRIVGALARLDEVPFSPHRWRHAEPGGGGARWTVEGGTMWERGGVDTYTLPAPPRGPHTPEGVWLTGLSLALYPRNPHVPGVRMGLQSGCAAPPGHPSDKQWFEGFATLTPYCTNPSESQSFLHSLEGVFRAHPGVADTEAFRISGEEGLARPGPAEGAVGLTFGPLSADPEGTFLFVRQLGRAFLPAYLPLTRHAAQPYGEPERERQVVLRARYEAAMQRELEGWPPESAARLPPP
jgi:coproporphyrinogen III oxidase